MTYISRHIDAQLLEWKNSSSRKPLLLRGARQVGKSTAIKHLGELFDYFIDANLQKKKGLAALFEQDLDAHELAKRIGLLYNIPVIAGRTLLFIDEIQLSIAAINSLWSFKEDFPELHVVAAGSLLEFALKEMPMLGVGRIHSLFLYPMSFDEFLAACGKQEWLDAKRKASSSDPLYEELHNELQQLFRTYLLVGGMPASVAAWVDTHDYFKCAAEMDDILMSYRDDFKKYAKKSRSYTFAKYSPKRSQADRTEIHLQSCGWWVSYGGCQGSS